MQEERDDKCISLQETVWGTDVLKRLESIKDKLDPNYMFDCNGCVGNNRLKVNDNEVEPATESAEENEADPSSSDPPAEGEADPSDTSAAQTVLGNLVLASILIAAAVLYL